MIDLAIPCLMLMAFCGMLMGIRLFLLGAIQSLGLQAKASIFSVLLAYLLGLPLEIILGFKAGMGLFGIFVGFMVVQVLLFIIFFLILMCRDWQ